MKSVKTKKKIISGKKQPKKGKKKSLFRRVIRFFIFLLIGFLTVSFLQVLALKWMNPITSSFMVIRNAELLFSGKPSKIRYEWRDFEEISPYFPLAVIAAEDQKFPLHYGFDIKAIETALEENKKGNRIRGGSTISQQVAKNLFCWPGRSYFRKGIESYYTVLIEMLWNKKRILEVYINIAELGSGIYGAEAASQKFFNKDASKLSKEEAAQLAAVLPSPRKYSATSPSPYMIKRKEWIKRQMLQLGDKKYLEKL